MTRRTGAGQRRTQPGEPASRADIAGERAASGTVAVVTPPVSSATLREVAAPVGAFGGQRPAATRARHVQETVPLSPEAMRTLLEASAPPGAVPTGGRYSIRAPRAGRTEMPLAPASAAPTTWGPTSANAEQGAKHHEIALALMKQRRWDHALEEALRAVHLDSGNPQHEATYAWILYQAGPPRRQTDAQISAHLNRALKLDRGCTQAHYVLGLLRKRQGKHEAAEAHFRMALDGDPEHLEAQRELRLYAKRRSRSAESGLMQRIVDKLTAKRARTRPNQDDDE